MATRSALLCPLLMTCLGSISCSPSTNLSPVSILPPRVGNSWVPYRFRLKSELHDHRDDGYVRDEHSTKASNMKTTAGPEPDAYVSLQSRQSTVPEGLSMDNALGNCFHADKSDEYMYHGTMLHDLTTQESFEVIVNPNEKVNISKLDCPIWDELTKFFHYNNTLLIYSSMHKSISEERAFSCDITVTVPIDLNLKVQLECVGLVCCLFLNRMRIGSQNLCVDQSDYGTAPGKTTVFLGESAAISLHKDNSSGPFHVDISITAFQHPADLLRWEILCTSPTQGQCAWKS